MRCTSSNVFVDNIWSCSEADVAGLLWLLSRQSQINDSSSTFCAKVKTNSWSNNLATEPVRARVGLLELLNFTQVRERDRERERESASEISKQRLRTDVFC